MLFTRQGKGGKILDVNDDMYYLSSLLPVTTFFNSTRFGCLHCCSTLSSRTEVTGMPANRDQS